MKHLLILAILAALLVPALGCGDGVAYSRRERENRYKQIIDNDFRQLTDDWDYLWLMEHRSHLSRWKVE